MTFQTHTTRALALPLLLAFGLACATSSQPEQDRFDAGPARQSGIGAEASNSQKEARDTLKQVERAATAAITVVTQPDKAVKDVGKGVLDAGKSIGRLFGI